MAKSLRSQLTAAADLVAILGLTQQDAYSVRIDRDATTFQMDPVALARVSRKLDVPRKRIETSESEHDGRKFIHIDFHARGCRWTACLRVEDLPQFYAQMGVEPVKRIGTEALKLSAAKPPAGPSPRLELFPAAE